MTSIELKAKKYIAPLRMNKLHGRMMRLPAKKGRKREILLVYGHHASLERMFGIAEYLNRYGAVTVPDLPGFGGMQSFYRIGKEPTIDNLADYLASFCALKYKHRRISIVCISFSMPVVTRMLQKYPHIAKRVDMLVSFVGFVHKDDFRLNRYQMLGLSAFGRIFSLRLPAFLLHNTLFTKKAVKFAYRRIAGRHSKLKDLSEYKKEQVYDMEAHLWKVNDTRTRFKTILEMVNVDLCNNRVDLPLHQVYVSGDKYFDNRITTQHLKIVFSDVTSVKSAVNSHAPTLLANAREVAPYIPKEIRRVLR